MLNAPSAKSTSAAPAARRRLTELVRVLRRNARRPGAAAREAPLRAELFSAEQMEHHGANLAAASHRLGGRGTRNDLLPRLAQNEVILAQACALLTADIRAERPITPAGEWLLDNFYLIEEQIRTARRHLPVRYSRALPQLVDGLSAGLPRVYDIALEIIAHGDGQVDPNSMARFIAAYQTVEPLTLGELWAIPIMLRLALIENLRRVAARIADASAGRTLAGQWADQMLRIVETDPKSVILVVADMARSQPPASSAFVAELSRRLQGQSPALGLAISWVEQHLAEVGYTVQQLVNVETQHQAADQVSIANSIGSLRFLDAVDWRTFVESMSVVERTLREDPASVYAGMDFATRDRYRHVIERLARRSKRPEVDVATAALELAKTYASSASTNDRRAHVGYVLVDAGRAALEARVGLRQSPIDRLREFGERHPLALYLGSIGALTLLFARWLVDQAHSGGAQGGWLALDIFVLVICASQLGVAIVNWLATLIATPAALPRMDCRDGLPPDARTLVVVPTMLVDAPGVDALVDALEVRFLANRDEQLHFGLLTDFVDAPSEEVHGDDVLVDIASRRIEALNARYGAESFFLFHRPRRFNAGEGAWIGFERKRGKLGDLNALLRDRGAAGRFARIVGDVAVLRDIRYVITLDTDTWLPHEAARSLVGAMLHPLNRPHFDERTRRVVDGYAILQPRVAATLPAEGRSLYATLTGGEPGLDPYTRTVSDVYQDLFGEGSFIGKGIYDVDAFEHALRGRFPDNRILSHDLLEGLYARSGLITDVQVYEEDPSTYAVDMRRRHRWIRGDWQIASWLGWRVPAAAGATERNPLSLLSRWKILDNLRRSLVAPALFAVVVIGWGLLADPWLWTWIAIAIVALPAANATLLEVTAKSHDMTWRAHLRMTLASIVRRVLQSLFTIAVLPYEAVVNLDAILRTTVRVVVTQRHLLQWMPSALERRSGPGVLASYALMWSAPVIALAITAWLAWLRPDALGAAAPFLALWLAAPLIAAWLARPAAPPREVLDGDDTAFLRTIARRTWQFFDEIIGPEDHWLPPDNFQEAPAVVIAHRTSPTNIGLSLLANLAAYDFGYLSTHRLVARIEAAFETLAKLQRYRGHFLNWYDTRTLEPLHPRYVSSVDSGNLAGHLITLRAGLRELVDAPVVPDRWLDGLDDTFALLRESGEDAPALRSIETALARARADAPRTLTDVRAALQAIAAAASDDTVRTEGQRWQRALNAQCSDFIETIDAFAPWCARPAEMGSHQTELDRARTLADLAYLPTLLDLDAAGLAGDDPTTLQQSIVAGARRAADCIATLNVLRAQIGGLATFEYGFLYDDKRKLMSIGYNVSEHRLDAGRYDLLASEARLAVYIGVAQGALPQESWFALGRLLTLADGEPILLSWSGSMFEYLMPMLVMPTFRGTLLEHTAAAAVRRQVRYGRQRGVPWGISECGYNVVDAAFNYQYRAFGVPGLGLQRGLAEDLVIAPYASALALMVAPRRACSNLRELAGGDALGRFGFHEAIDFTPSRLRRGQDRTVIQSFMAHHQGMTLLAIAHALLDEPMQRRFVADLELQSTLLLLQERVPKARASYSTTPALVDLRTTADTHESPVRVFDTADTAAPAVQLLSNGRYHVMVTNAGGGYSRWKDIALIRWREDATCDPWGNFCYLRDTASGRVWSPTFLPSRAPADRYEVTFSESRVDFRRRDGDFDTHTEIVVSPEDDVELRRLHITNRSRGRRWIEVTSYAEVVLTPPAADALHPAFSNLFVQTEIVSERRALLCSRRPRSRHDFTPSLFHVMTVHGVAVGDASYETDRAKFIGRGNSVADPQVLREPGPLSGSAGSVLDPIVAIRQRISLEPDRTVVVDMVTGAAADRAECIALVEKYQDRRLADRAFEMAWTHNHIVLRQLNVTEADAQLYGRLTSSIIYADAALRTAPDVIARNRRGQSGLWGYAISGDLPIVLLQVQSAESIELVRQLVRAHAYWRLKGLRVDLVIWNEERGGYRHVLQDQIMGLIAGGIASDVIDRPGGIFVRAAEQIAAEDRVLLQAVARAIFSDGNGSLAEQVRRRPRRDTTMPALAVVDDLPEPTPAAPYARPKLLFDNGLGGFAQDGREYVIVTSDKDTTPAPWVNVIANPWFGCVVSEQGPTYTWLENAHEFRLTPWHNDPVTDASGEAFYVRDQETGRSWSPTPLPRRGEGPYTCRHGFGYTAFEHTEEGIASELGLHVAIDAPLRFAVLRLRNVGRRPRQLAVTNYVEWVLGDIRPKTAMHVVTEIDPGSGAVFARNAYHPEFGDRVAFLDVDDVERTVTGDRAEFVGRNGTLRSPAALSRARLSGKVGAALDPCTAIQVIVDLAPGQMREIVFRMGVGRGTEDANRLVMRYRQSGSARATLDAAKAYWQETLDAVQIRTPDPTVDLLANGWLVYQTLACRVWARTGYYQSGGAYGFRDQLQDAMALVHTRPDLLREQLLRAASRQFVEGDVQHWWHPPLGRGVRSHCSDDFLWLPLATSRYVECTSDVGVLGERIPFLEGRPVPPEDESYYDLPARANEQATLYQHGVRAIERGLRFGSHGLPLMGAGDWNDGMNNVGARGRGESVWLGWFLIDVLRRFGTLADRQGDAAFAQRCAIEADTLRGNIERNAWDGRWYRRAYFDDGTPLGTAAAAECQIDSISQSWSVLSGAGDTVRSRVAMQAVDERLVRREHALVQLLDPPFDVSDPDPGYIRGYVPGVRENGGQYTHAAIWTAMAFAGLGDAERAWEIVAMINPLGHSRTRDDVATYRAEPYVVAADVYAVPPHTGRAGWSWYTGSAGWMYRLILESLLGVTREGNRLRFAPRLPVAWPSCEIRYRFGATMYTIVLSHGANDAEATIVRLDGVVRTGGLVPLVDDRLEHAVEVIVATTARDLGREGSLATSRMSATFPQTGFGGR